MRQGGSSPRRHEVLAENQLRVLPTQYEESVVPVFRFRQIGPVMVMSQSFFYVKFIQYD